MATMRTARSKGLRGFSLVEVLTVIGVLGMVAALAIPILSNVFDQSQIQKDRRNAQQIAWMSDKLASIGVAHVLPESLGGIEATARLLREGVIVPEGPFDGESFRVSGLTDEEIHNASDYLELIYHSEELRIAYKADE